MKNKINWISSKNSKNKIKLEEFSKKLQNYYANNTSYYAEIDFTANNWISKHELSYQEIIKYFNSANKILEIGCGSANALMHYDISEKYYGIDFSEKLMDSNKARFPKAQFDYFRVYNELPYADNSFDFVYSVFVLEHCIFPLELLNEMQRVVKPGGRLIVFCPDFLGCNRMASQLPGFSIGTGRAKFVNKKYLDAIITGFDNKIRIPIVSILKKVKINLAISDGFYVNINPICFLTNHFEADFDAVYLTYKNEIVKSIEKQFSVLENSQQLLSFEKSKGIIIINAQKK